MPYEVTLEFDDHKIIYEVRTKREAFALIKKMRPISYKITPISSKIIAKRPRIITKDDENFLKEIGLF